MKLSRPKITLAALACVASLALAACGGDDDEAETSTTTAVAVASEPDLARYCELVTQLDASSNAIFEELGADGSVPTPEDLAAAQQRVFDENAALIDEMSRVAPEEIADDFELTLESARERAASGDATEPPAEVAEAGVRLQEFRRDNCPKPGDAQSG